MNFDQLEFRQQQKLIKRVKMKQSSKKKKTILCERLIFRFLKNKKNHNILQPLLIALNR